MTKDDILQRIQTDLPSAVRFYQHTGVEMGLLRELGNDLDVPGVEVFLASMANTPSRLLETLCQRGHLEVLQLLAQNPNFLVKLAANADAAVRKCVAQSRRITPQLALQLAADSAVDVRMALARNPVIPPNVQLKLSEDAVPFVRLSLLSNRKLDEEFQIGLGDDIDTTVHLGTLLTPRLSFACMKIWADFDEELGQLALSTRSDLPPPIVQQLSKSKYPSVQLSLLRHQQLPAQALVQFAATGDEATREALAQRADLPPEVQQALWADGQASPKVRRALAQCLSLTDELGQQLADTHDSEVRQALALNPGDALVLTREALARTGDAPVLKRLLANPLAHEPHLLSTLIEHAPEEVLPHLAFRRIDCSGVSAAAQHRLAASVLPSVQALANPAA